MTINWREEIIKLFPETTERTLKENHIWCNDCNGLGLKRHGEHIIGCVECYGKGQIELCECGNKKLRGWTICEDCRIKALKNNEINRFNKAEKIHYDDYDGRFIVNDDTYNKDDFEEWLYDRITEREEYPIYMFATKQIKVLDIDLNNVIQNCVENGYDDMSEHLDYKGIEEIQEKIDKWIDDQGDSAYCYEEDYSRVILLDKLIDELKGE